MAKKVEYFISQRTDRAMDLSVGGIDRSSSHMRGRGGAILIVAQIAIALSVAVMILTISVVKGFRREVHLSMTANSGDILIATVATPNPSSRVSIVRCDGAITQLVDSVVVANGATLRSIRPFALRSAVLRATDGVEGVVLKGVEMGDGGRGAAIAEELSREYEIGVGDRLELFVFEADDEARRDLYRVDSVGVTQRELILTDLHNVQRINGWGEDEISGYEVSITPQSRASEITQQLNRELIYDTTPQLDGYVAHSVERLFPAIFDWLAALDLNAVVVVAIMMIVAIFNIITAMLILVLERVQMVGILKTLGMCNGAIRRIFLYRAGAITLRGLAWGNGIAVALALIQREWGVVRLDASGYILDVVPIDLGLGWLMALNVGVVVTVLVVIVVPTRVVSSIDISKALKFQ